MLETGSPTFVEGRSVRGSPVPNNRQDSDPLDRLKEIAQARSLTRSRSQCLLVMEFMKDNRIFSELPFSSRLMEGKETANAEIAAEAEIVWVQEDSRLSYMESELLLFISGAAYEYVQNFYQESKVPRSGRRRSANHEAHQEFALIRKIKPHEYFSSYLPKSRYEGDQRKMQLVAEASTLVVRIRDDLFQRYFERKLEFHMQESYGLLCEFDMMRELRRNLIFELTKYMERVAYARGTVLYSKGDRSDYFYFLRKGSVLLKQEREASLDGRSLSKKFVVRNTTSSLLLESGSVIGVDGILVNTSSDLRMYTAETVSEVEVWRIDKRPLIVLISSYGQHDPEPKKINQVNLTSQMAEVEFSNRQQELLQENVKRIKTSEKKIRDIKLKSMGSSTGMRRRANSQASIRYGIRQKEELYNDLRETVRTAGIHKVTEQPNEEMRHMQATPAMSAQTKVYETPTSQTIPVGTTSWFGQAQQTINTILLVPDNPDEPTPEPQMSRSNYIPRSISSKLIKSCSRHGKEEKQIILSHLEKKRNNELKSKLLNVHENKSEQKQSELVHVKRMFQAGRSKRSEPVIPSKKIEDALLSKMCSMNDSPLLFNMESLRKRLLEGSSSPFVNKIKQKLLKNRVLPPSRTPPVQSQKQNYSSKILINDM